jgi:DNA primase
VSLTLDQHIRLRVDLVALVREYVPWGLKRRCKRSSLFDGLCPWCYEQNQWGPLTVSDCRSIFACKRCKRHGNCFDFIMEAEHLTRIEARDYLAARVGLEFPR